MYTLNLSDAQSYALSNMIRDFILDNNVEETTKEQFETIRKGLLNHAFNKLSFDDMDDIQNILYKGGV